MSKGALAGKTCGFLGGGMMASALMGGIVNAGLANPSDIHVSDPYEPCLKKHADAGFQVTSNNKLVAQTAQVLWVAVKPHMVASLLEEVKDDVDGTLVVSIAAGVTIATLEAALPAGTRVVRVMPNTPCLVGQTAAGFAAGTHATTDDVSAVEQVLSAVGIACQVKEYQLDAVTGLSGSGPAYVFMMIEALADGGVRAGLPRPVAMQLASQTVKGAAAMVQETGLHPGVLKDQVMSPGGTTAAGVHALETGGIRATLMNAVLAASQQAQLLGKL